MDFQTTLWHNTIYFSVLVKIYEMARCTPASNSSTLENGFADGRHLISRGGRARGGDSQRERAMPHNVFPTLKSSQFGSTVFLRLQMSAIVLQYTIRLNIFPRSPCRILLTLDWTEQVRGHQSSLRHLRTLFWLSGSRC